MSKVITRFLEAMSTDQITNANMTQCNDDYCEIEYDDPGCVGCVDAEEEED